MWSGFPERYSRITLGKCYRSRPLYPRRSSGSGEVLPGAPMVQFPNRRQTLVGPGPKGLNGLIRVSNMIYFRATPKRNRSREMCLVVEIFQLQDENEKSHANRCRSNQQHCLSDLTAPRCVTRTRRWRLQDAWASSHGIEHIVVEQDARLRPRPLYGDAHCSDHQGRCVSDHA